VSTEDLHVDVSDAAGVRFMQGFQKIETELELRGVSFADLCAIWVMIQRRWLSSDYYETCYGGTDGVYTGRTRASPRGQKTLSLIH